LAACALLSGRAQDDHDAGLCPHLIDPDEIEQLRSTEDLRQNPAQSTWTPGAACLIIGGPFRDQPAVVASINGSDATVTLMMFGELRHLPIPVDRLAPLE
jgi:transcription antitermination factor NusG